MILLSLLILFSNKAICVSIRRRRILGINQDPTHDHNLIADLSEMSQDGNQKRFGRVYERRKKDPISIPNSLEGENKFGKVYTRKRKRPIDPIPKETPKPTSRKRKRVESDKQYNKLTVEERRAVYKQRARAYYHKQKAKVIQGETNGKLSSIPYLAHRQIKEKIQNKTANEEERKKFQEYLEKSKNYQKSFQNKSENKIKVYETKKKYRTKHLGKYRGYTKRYREKLNRSSELRSE